MPGGYLKFYSAGTTTPKDVFGEKALTTNNGSTIALDASSRPSPRCLGSGAYFVEIYDTDDNKQGEADNVEIPGGEATAFRAGSRQIPDQRRFGHVVGRSGRTVPRPTGHADRVLSSDGTVLTWIAKPANGADGVSDTASDHTTFRVGNILVQSGTATAPSNTSVRTSVNITFATAYTKIWAVLPVVNTTSVSTGNGGAIPVDSVTGYTPGSAATGATINFRNPSDGDIIDSGDYISSSVPVSWIAIGEAAAP